jgi:capsular exopolysaccharide synthesis family protein
VSRIDEVLRRASGDPLAAPHGAPLPPPPPEADETLDLWSFPEREEPEAMLVEVAAPAAAAELATPSTAPPPPAAEPAASGSPGPGPGDEAPAAGTRPAPAIADTLVTRTMRRDAVEQYAKLAATLHHAQTTHGTRMVLCTSAVGGEGKTVTATNVAMTLAHSYHRKVLLIDADMRRARVHSTFGLENATGLYDALIADDDQKLPVVAISPYLSILTAGHPGPDPVPVLTSERLGRVLDAANLHFDWVIIDTPPVLLFPDTGLLMAKADASLLVIAAGTTPYRLVRRTVEAIGRERIIGVVMNRAPETLLQGSYGGYYHYYEHPVAQ